MRPYEDIIDARVCYQPAEALPWEAFLRWMAPGGAERRRLVSICGPGEALLDIQGLLGDGVGPGQSSGSTEAYLALIG